MKNYKEILQDRIETVGEEESKEEDNDGGRVVLLGFTIHMWPTRKNEDEKPNLWKIEERKKYHTNVRLIINLVEKSWRRKKGGRDR